MKNRGDQDLHSQRICKSLDYQSDCRIPLSRCAVLIGLLSIGSTVECFHDMKRCTTFAVRQVLCCSCLAQAIHLASYSCGRQEEILYMFKILFMLYSMNAHS